MRYTEKRNGKNVIPLRNAVCGVDLPHWSIDKQSEIQSFLMGDAVERLAELEDKIEQGTLVELPCKVGDTVYVIADGMWHCQEVWQFRYDMFGLSVRTVGDHPFDFEWGERAFLTREEAEKRLLELQGDK
jgi:hypothetical protein